MLAGGRIRMVGSRLVRDPCAVAERPDLLAPFDAKLRVDDHAPALVDRKPETAEQRLGAHPCRPHERLRLEPAAVRECDGVVLDGLERGRDADVDAPFPELTRRVFAEP